MAPQNAPHGADLREADLTGADLREADLTGAWLDGATFNQGAADLATVKGLATAEGAQALYSAAALWRLEHPDGGCPDEK